MKMVRNYVRVLFLLLIPTCAFAQQSRIDSLKQALKTARTDSVRFGRLIDLGWEYAETNRDTALGYSERGLALVKKNGYELNRALALWQKGYLLMHLDKLPQSLASLQEGIKLAEDPANEKNLWYWYLDKKMPDGHTARITAIANLHQALGLLMGATGNVEQQILNYKIAQPLAIKIGDNDLQGLIMINLGAAYSGLNRLDSALIYEQNAERVMKQTGFKKYLGIVYLDIGNIYLQKGNKQRALQYLYKGLATNPEKKTLRVPVIFMKF